MAGFGFNRRANSPFNAPDPFADEPSPFNSGNSGARRVRPEYRQPLPPEQADGMMRQLTNKGATGLQYVLSSLDKPGRAVRGLVGGHPDELAAVIPFSDSLGLTDPDRAVSGRDLLNKAGLTDKRDKGWGSWGAGLATEFALDPLTYATFGTGSALTQAGKVASKAGKLNGLSRAERIGQGLSGLAGVGLPFKEPSLVLGTGKAAQKLAGGIDKAADFTRFGNPVGRYLGAAFDHRLDDARDAITQKAALKYGTPALEGFSAERRGHETAIKRSIRDLIKQGQFPERDILSAIRETVEGVPMDHVHPQLQAAVGPVGQHLRGIFDEHLAEARKLGLPLSDLNDWTSAYMPRSAVDIKAHGLQLRGENKFPTRSGANMHRDELYRGIPGGSEAWNRWVAQFAGHDTPVPVNDTIRKEMLDTVNKMGKTLTQAEADALDTKALDLTKRLARMPQEYRATQQGPFKGGLTEPGLGTFFSPDVAGDAVRRMDKRARTAKSALAVYGAVKDNARKMSELGLDGVPLGKALKALGLVTTWGGQGVAHEGAAMQALERLTGSSARFANRSPKFVRKALNRYGLARQDFDALASQYPKWTAPHTVGGPVAGLDTATNMFKNLAYSVWPASHVRNAGSALANNLMYGGSPGGHFLAYKVMRDTATAAEIAASHPGMPAGLADDAARDWVRAQAYQHGKIFGGHNGATDLAGKHANLLSGDQITGKVPGDDRTGPTGNFLGDVLNLAKEGVAGGADVGGGVKTSPKSFFGQAGVGGRTVDTWSPLHSGRVAGSNVEDYFRLSQYLGHVKDGVDPAEAGRLVNKLHFDYEAMTPFEKKVMRRLVPFYTFQRKNLPLQVERVMSRPSAISAQLRPGVASDPKEYTPDHIASGVAIPTGPEKDGNQQYISQLGLPVEEAFERLKFKGNMPDLRATALSYAGGLNPAIKGPLELLFDKQFHTNRNLSDLRPAGVGQLFGEDNAGLATQVLANTPATRFLTAADKLLDERKPWWAKALNLMSGVRVSDVDMDKSRAIEARKALEEQLRGHKDHVSSYTNFYVKPGEAGNLTPDEVEQMRMLSLLQQNARAFAERQRQAAGR